METKTIPDELFEDVRSVFMTDSTGHDYYHTLRVYRTAVNLALLENADPYATGLGALLHDVDDFTQSNGQLTGFDRASLIMGKYGIEQPTREHVKKIIQMVVLDESRNRSLDTIEGWCVLDAVRLDESGAIGIARAFALGGRADRAIYDPLLKPRVRNGANGSSSTSTVNYFYEKLLKLKEKMTTPSGKRIASHRHRFIEQYLEEFFAEWSGEL